LAAAENLDAVVIAAVTSNDDDAVDTVAALKMKWRGKTIVDLSRTFLNANGAPRSAQALLPAQLNAKPDEPPRHVHPGDALGYLQQELMSLRSGSRRGLQERFDGSIGAASVLFPWGGAEQGTPECGMAALLPSLEKQSRTASILTFGYDPDLMEQNPYEGAKGSIREALAKFVCLGGDYRAARLSLQEYFQRPVSPESWGMPAAALLGALEAQLALGIPAIGGKDSMSGNYRDAARGIDIAVPPTLVAFAAGTTPAASIRSGALSGESGNFIVLLAQKESYPEGNLRSLPFARRQVPAKKANPEPQPSLTTGKWSGEGSPLDLNEWDIFKANMDALAALSALGCIRSAYPVVSGGVAASLALMAFGNNTGIEAQPCAFAAGLPYQGSVLVEIDGTAFRNNPRVAEILGVSGCWEIAAVTIDDHVLRVTEEYDGKTEAGGVLMEYLRLAYESPLAQVYPQTSTGATVAEKPEEKMQRCISEWISPDNIKKAKGKTREEIFSLFGNKLESIAYLPYPYLSCLDAEITDNKIYCGKGYFIDHVVNHHPEVDPVEYCNIQHIIDCPDDVKLDKRFESRKALVFIKKTEKYGVIVIGIGKTERRKLVFYKSFFNNTKSPYPRLPSIRTCASLVDGVPTISRMESIPAGSLPALNDTLIISDTPVIVKYIPSSPLVVLPVFPGTNCEWDMERAFHEAGARTKLVIFRNRTSKDIAHSRQELAAAIAEAQILALSGGFSAGDEPDGSGKFIANVLRSPVIADAVSNLIENRDGLILGICNGFQALIKLGLVPYGAYRKADAAMPTLTFNRVGRHISRMVRTRVMANCSPWLALEQPGAVHLVPVSHGEGRVVIHHDEGEALFKNGQVPFCYADADGQPALYEPDNPNGSDFAIEGLCSPDGRILGKMGHSERRGEYVHINIPGNKRQNIFEAGVRYFK